MVKSHQVGLLSGNRDQIPLALVTTKPNKGNSTHVADFPIVLAK